MNAVGLTSPGRMWKGNEMQMLLVYRVPCTVVGFRVPCIRCTVYAYRVPCT